MSILNNIISKLSKGENLNKEETFQILGNCFGFLNVKGGIGTSSLIFELGNILASRNIRTCIIDTSPTSNFYVSKSNYVKKAKDLTDLPSIQVRLMKSTAPIKQCMFNESDNLSILSFGNADISSTFDMSFPIVNSLIEEVKEVFDIVLIDINLTPTYETFLSAIVNTSVLYTMMGYDSESILNYIKAKKLISHAGYAHKLNRLIVMQTVAGTSIKPYIENALEGTKVFLEVPDVRDFKKVSLTNRTLHDTLTNSDMDNYIECINEILQNILHSTERSNDN